ncbi:MarR family transcriptional regulator [Microbacterium sp. BK668]|uniref:MarR family winged helix-turn-helix transcriptional regulator n=1 Tax=Microbacterium sp. BK668 TaxID=2512118 RepID=UPI0010610E49|nr:MarR family transcriptional regulator [Microbacterium sp. BK668]TDN91627.1 MarR family transcriptional regulator [Microbacterium sp. BK668]
MTARAELVGVALGHIAAITREVTAARSRPFAEHRLSRNQLETLFVLAHAVTPVTVGDLAAALSVTPGAVSQLTTSLRDGGLVEVCTPPEDARVRVIRLTPSARAHVDAFEREVAERLAPGFDGLSDAELEQLTALLTTARSARRVLSI